MKITDYSDIIKAEMPELPTKDQNLFAYEFMLKKLSREEVYNEIKEYYKGVM